MHRAMKFSQFVNESANNMGLSSRELKEIDPKLTQEINDWISHEIIIFNQDISPEESRGINDFMEKSLVDMDWEIYRDGTANVSLFTIRGGSLSFVWEDEDGSERRGNLLNYVTRGVTNEIDPDAETGVFKLPRELCRLGSISFMPKGSSPIDIFLRDF